MDGLFDDPDAKIAKARKLYSSNTDVQYALLLTQRYLNDENPRVRAIGESFILDELRKVSFRDWRGLSRAIGHLIAEVEAEAWR